MCSWRTHARLARPRTPHSADQQSVPRRAPASASDCAAGLTLGPGRLSFRREAITLTPRTSAPAQDGLQAPRTKLGSLSRRSSRLRFPRVSESAARAVRARPRGRHLNTTRTGQAMNFSVTTAGASGRNEDEKSRSIDGYCGSRLPKLVGTSESGSPVCEAGFGGFVESAGMNRHGEGDDDALHRRRSESRWPRVMRWRSVRAQRSVDRGRAGGAIEPRNHNEVRGADALTISGRQHGWRRFRELLVDPARSEIPGTYASSMRENREIPRSPAGV